MPLTAAAGRALLAVFGVTACLVVAGCGESRQSTAPPAVTHAEARQVFERFTERASAARERLSVPAGRSLTMGADAETTAAKFRTAKQSDRTLPRYTYSEPRFFIPRLAHHPKWFVAVASRSGGDGTATQLLVFAKPQPQDAWRRALAPVLDDRTTLPAPMLDEDGYAAAAPAHDDGLTANPQAVPSLQAALAEEGPENPAAQVMAPGPYTTGRYEADEGTERVINPAGFKLGSTYHATDHPVYALRTASGGALVLYAVSHDKYFLPRSPDSGATLPVPSELTALAGTSRVGERLEYTEVHQHVAVDPPKGEGKCRVVGYAGEVTSVQAD